MLCRPYRAIVARGPHIVGASPYARLLDPVGVEERGPERGYVTPTGLEGDVVTGAPGGVEFEAEG